MTSTVVAGAHKEISLRRWVEDRGIALEAPQPPQRRTLYGGMQTEEDRGSKLNPKYKRKAGSNIKNRRSSTNSRRLDMDPLSVCKMLSIEDKKILDSINYDDVPLPDGFRTNPDSIQTNKNNPNNPININNIPKIRQIEHPGSKDVHTRGSPKIMNAKTVKLRQFPFASIEKYNTPIHKHIASSQH